MPKGQQHRIEKSRELQRRLYLAAKRSRGRRFHALYDRIYRPDIMWRAWIEVKENGGSAGVDGITIKTIEQQGAEEYLQAIVEEMKNGTYRPQPVRRVNIPKPDGKQRPLGIPTVKDRIVQQACKIVIEPIFEANFCNSSYGFRPRRSAQQALSDIRNSLVYGWYVVDCDIQGYFENIDHEILITLVAKRVSDRRVLKLIRQWLKAGFMENGKKYPTEKGSPQGGVISPLLANIYLHVMDTYWERNYQQLGKLYRYCDDFVIISERKQDAFKAHRIIKAILGRLKLTLHPTKTKVLYTRHESFDFLGFHFQKMKAMRTGRLVPYMWPSQKAMKVIRETIRRETGRNKERLLEEQIIKKINPIIRGWRNYFQIGQSTQKLKKMDWYVYYRLGRFRQFGSRRGKRETKTEFTHWYNQCGIERFYPQRVCATKT